MSEYRVYRSGEAEPVRIAGVAVPESLAAARESAGDARSPSSAHGVALRSRLAWAAVGLAAALAVVLLWLYGRDIFANSLAAVDLAKLSGKVPSWSTVAAPVVAVAAVVGVTAYLAFGRYLGLKIAGVAVVVVALAAPGIALGWANGLVSVVGGHTAQQARVVAQAKEELSTPPLPGSPMNILLIGSDKSGPTDPGRSDTQILMRLDPETKSISMLSLPRDLRVDIPGVGIDKMNAAYAYGGPKLVIQTFKQLTGLPINHYIEINFAGFWHAVNILGGVYIPVDHRYYNPPGTGWKSIDLQPGYQLVRGKQALNFVRFRHDQLGDFTRMQRQQLFLKEMQRQSGRWRQDWAKVLTLIKAITRETTSDIDSLNRLEPLVELIFQVNTSKVYTVHLEGSTPMINGVSYVVPSQQQIDQAVAEFTNPVQPPVQSSAPKLSKKMYSVTVFNGSGIGGLATTAANQLAVLGYTTDVGPDAPEFPGQVTVVYAPKSLAVPAQQIAGMFWPSDVRLVDRAPGAIDGIRVFVASSFGGVLKVPQASQQAVQTLLKNQNYDAASWMALAATTPLHLEMPTAWSAGLSYDQFRAYGIKTVEGKTTAAAVAVVRSPLGGFATIQTMRWLNPPAIQNPNSTQSIGGTKYLFFFQSEHLHMVAWKRNGTLYWLLNTLDNQLSNDLMLGLATSFKPVK